MRRSVGDTQEGKIMRRLLAAPLLALPFLAVGCLGSPAHNREHVRQIKQDLNSIHDDFDYVLGLRANWPVEFPNEPDK